MASFPSKARLKALPVDGKSQMVNGGNVTNCLRFSILDNHSLTSNIGT